MSNTVDGRRRLLDIALLTAAAFMAGGNLQRLLAAELAASSTGAETFSPWMLAPILVQGVVGCFGLAWALRDRYPMRLLWMAGAIGWALASTLTLSLVGWSSYENHMLFLVALVTALVLATMMRVAPSVNLRLGVVCMIGFTAGWAILVVELATTALAVQAGPETLVAAGISTQTLAAFLVIAQEFAIGATAAVGAAWASSQPRVPAPQRARVALRTASLLRLQAGLQ